MQECPKYIPDSPGVYIFYAQDKKVLYVGKAKNLKKRVQSYFRSNLALKVAHLVAEASKIEFFLTNTEKDALILEAELIKKYKPKYNVYFRDDKQYLLFVLDKRQPYPRLKISRRFSQGEQVFGPFTSAQQARETLRVINRVFKLRKCSNKNFNNRTRPCLQYHLKRCFAPCCFPISKEVYAQEVKKVELFLQGRQKDLLKQLEIEMWKFSQDLNFEQAALIRDQLKAIEQTLEKQSIVNFSENSLDVFYLQRKSEQLFLSVVYVREGRVVDQESFVLSSTKYLSPLEQWQNILAQFYLHRQPAAKVVISEKINLKKLSASLKNMVQTKIKVTSNPRYQDLIQLAAKNLNQQNSAYLLQEIFPGQEVKTIEALDVSHFYGQNSYLGSVCYQDNQFVKDNYRLYKFSHAQGDDFLPYREFLEQRQKKGNWPDLFLIDGGRAHLQIFTRFLAQKANVTFQVLAITKGTRRSLGNLDDKIYCAWQEKELEVSQPLLLFLQRLRDEAHRFVLQAQRKSRAKSVYQDPLLALSGIGEKTAKLLWQHFKTLEKILEADPPKLQQLPGIGSKKAVFLYEKLQLLKKCS